MDGRDLCQSEVLRAQRARYGGKSRHQPFHDNLSLEGAAEKPLQLGLRAHEINVAAPLDQWRTP